MAAIHKLDPRHWRIIRRTFDSIRQTYFSKKARNTQFRVNVGIDELREELGKLHFTNGWELSYQYKGEDLNMRRPQWRDDQYNWYQLHVRAFEVEGKDYVEVHAHYELEPTEHPYGHIQGTNFEINTGADMFEDILDDLQLPYSRSA